MFFRILQNPESLAMIGAPPRDRTRDLPIKSLVPNSKRCNACVARVSVFLPVFGPSDYVIKNICNALKLLFYHHFISSIVLKDDLEV